MAEFHIEIAGWTFYVNSLFESTRDYCKNYLTDRRADYAVTVTREDLIREQAALDAEAREEGLKRRKFTDPFLERAVIQRKIAELLLPHGIFLLHGSTVAVDGQAYLFTAKCGTGKSTHTKLWRQVFGDRAVMVNDDRPFLKLTEAGILACGSPWSGKHGLDSNVTLPLKGICILERGLKNRIRRITPEEGLPLLLHQGGLHDGPDCGDLVCAAASRTALWQMDCNMEAEAALLSWQTMAGHNEASQEAIC